MILKSYKAERLINTRNLDESKILNSIQEFIKLHNESEWETCLADVLFCITLTGINSKQESKKWNVKLLNIYDVAIEINQIIQNYSDLEEEQLAQQLDEELNACHDEKPCVLGDSLFDDDEDEPINVFVDEEKDSVQEQINQANADEIEEKKESSPYVSSSEDRTFQGYKKDEDLHLDKTLDYSDEMTVDTVEDLPQSSTIEKLEQVCRVVATVSITTMLLSGAFLMTALAIHQVKTLF